MSDYYKDLWTTPRADGKVFYETVDFNLPPYRYQEKIFREYIKNLNVKTVLELGSGTGRMTKIMLEEKISYDDGWYTIIEISKDNIKKMAYDLGLWMCLSITPLCGDIMEVDKILDEQDPAIPRKYDLILASEVFMHIKPKDISVLLGKLSKIGKEIINIDWYYENRKSNWCFIHPYHQLYLSHGAELVNKIPMKIIQQCLLHYRFSS